MSACIRLVVSDIDGALVRQDKRLSDGVVAAGCRVPVWRSASDVDGGQCAASVRRSFEAGADVIVAGTAIFGTADYAQTIARIRKGAGS